MVTDADIREWAAFAGKISRRYYFAGADRDDVYQEALVGLLKGLRTYRPELGVPKRKFLGMAIEYHLISMVKRAQAVKHRPLTDAYRIGGSGDVVATVTEMAPCPRGSVAEIAERREALRVLIDALSELTEFERAAYDGYLAGESYGEMADRLARSEKSIDNSLTRTRRKLRERLAA